MILRSIGAALPLALTACGLASSDPKPDRLLVVPATAARDAATLVRAAPLETAATPARHAPTLTVEESARINTTEMWSEPIAADADEIVIE